MELNYTYPTDDHLKCVDAVVDALDNLKKQFPNMQITIEIPGSATTCVIEDALIYYDMNANIVIDAE